MMIRQLQKEKFKNLIELWEFISGIKSKNNHIISSDWPHMSQKLIHLGNLDEH